MPLGCFGWSKPGMGRFGSFWVDVARFGSFGWFCILESMVILNNISCSFLFDLIF